MKTKTFECARTPEDTLTIEPYGGGVYVEANDTCNGETVSIILDKKSAIRLIETLLKALRSTHT